MIQWKSIKPRPIRARAFTEAIHAELRKQGAITKRALEATVSTWSNKPRFRVDPRTKGDAATVAVSTTDPRYRWVNEGTRTRWAVMSRDWRSKSTPRTIGSRAGRGRVVIRGRQAMQQRNIKPRPGIKAREYTQEIAKRRRPFFYKAMREAIARGKRNAYK